MKKKGIIGIVLALCLLLVFVSPVLAAGGLTVSGAKIETSVKPSNNYSYTMKVENTFDNPIDIGVEVKGYGMSVAQDFIALEPKDDSNPYSARELLTVSPTNFHLEPGNSQVITVTAKIPSGIGNGGRYAIVFIHTIPAKDVMVATITAVAARVLLTISGSSLDTNSKITEVSIEKTTSQKPAGVMVTIANNGNCHYKPQIQAKLRNGNTVVATTSLVAPGWPIIPGYSRQFTLNFVGSTPIPAGKYTADVEVKDESGKLITQGSFPVEFAEKQEVLPPEKPVLPTPTAPTTPSTLSPAPTPQTPSQPPTPLFPPAPQKTEFPIILVAGIAAGTVIVIVLIVALTRRRRY